MSARFRRTIATMAFIKSHSFYDSLLEAIKPSLSAKGIHGSAVSVTAAKLLQLQEPQCRHLRQRAKAALGSNFHSLEKLLHLTQASKHSCWCFNSTLANKVTFRNPDY